MTATVTSAPIQRSRGARFFEAWPPLTLAALAWIALMLVVALGADWLAPYHFSALDLKARLLPPVGFGGNWRHALILRVCSKGEGVFGDPAKMRRPTDP